MKLKQLAAVLMLMVTLVQPLITTYAADPKVMTRSLESLGYDDISLVGLQSGTGININYQSNWAINQDAQVIVYYTASPVLNRTRSTLSVLANNRLVQSLRPVGDGAEHSLSFTIPASYLAAGPLYLRFEAYLRLTDDNCEETANPGQWLTISKRTQITLSGEEKTVSPTLENMSNELIVQNPFDVQPAVVFVLPDQWSNTQLTTLTRVASRLGRQVGGAIPPFQISTLGNLTAEQKANNNLVMIGKPEELPQIPAENPAYLPTPIPGSVQPTPVVLPTVGPDEGYIRIATSPWNPVRRVLLISAKTDEETAAAGRIFTDSNLFPLLTGSMQKISSLAISPDSGANVNPWLKDSVSLADLGISDRNVNNEGVSNSYFQVQLPYGWTVEPGSQITFNAVFSPALRADQSYVAAYVNDVFLGSMAATDATAGNVQATFNLPAAEINKVGPLMSFKLVVSNALTLTQCEPTQPNTAWTQISSTSSLRIVSKKQSWPNLQAFPYPFLQTLESVPLIVVVPTAPTADDLKDALSLIMSIGRSANADFDVSILTADQVNQQKPANENLIVLGTKAYQALIGSMNTNTSFDNKLVQDAIKNPDFGILWETVSPWNPQRAVLMVYSASPTAYKNAIGALLNVSPPVPRSAVIAVFDASLTPRVVYSPPQSVQPSPTAAATSTEPQPTESATQPAAAVLPPGGAGGKPTSGATTVASTSASTVAKTSELPVAATTKPFSSIDPRTLTQIVVAIGVIALLFVGGLFILGRNRTRQIRVNK